MAERLRKHSMYDVSVVIPVYNISEAVLRQCIDSVIRQKGIEIEIFIIDDGSEEECVKLCDSFKEMDCRIQVIHQTNQGVSVARNEGIKRARGEWIAFVDGDDWLESDMLSVMVEYGNKNAADIVLCDCYINYNKKQVKTHFFEEDELSLADSDKYRFLMQVLCPRMGNDKASIVDAGVPWAKLYRRSFLFEKNIFFNKNLRRMQDNVFNLYAFEYANSIFYLHMPLYHYRKSVNSGIYRYNPDISDIYEIYFKEVLDYIVYFDKDKSFKNALNYKIFFSIYVIMNNDILSKNNPSKYRVKKKKMLMVINSPYYEMAIKEMEVQYLNNIEKIFFNLVRHKFFMGMYLAVIIKKVVFKVIGRGVQG